MMPLIYDVFHSRRPQRFIKTFSDQSSHRRTFPEKC